MPEKTKPSEPGKAESPAPTESTTPAEAGQPTGTAEPPDSYELIYTVKGATGEVVKIEKVCEGKREELSEEEYGQMAALYGAGAAEDYDAAALYAAYGAGYEDLTAYSDAAAYAQAYYAGIADYAAAVEAAVAAQAAEEAGYSSEELAYYQGMADYAASLA